MYGLIQYFTVEKEHVTDSTLQKSTYNFTVTLSCVHLHVFLFDIQQNLSWVATQRRQK